MDEERFKLAEQLYRYRGRHYVAHYFPTMVDTQYGGYYIYADPQLVVRQDRTQRKDLGPSARLLYGAAMMLQAEPANPVYISACKSGMEFFRDVMWDKEYGGFHARCDPTATTPFGGWWAGINCAKESYSTGFAMTALASYYRASGDTAALNLAIKCFRWMDEHGHDKTCGFYYGMFDRDGSVKTENHKDDNYGMHFMEGLVELYSVWPDPVLQERIHEAIRFFFDHFVSPQGNVWSVVDKCGNRKTSDIRFGHDVEIAYLILNAMGVSGWPITPDDLARCKSILDFSLKYGWDPTWDGLYYSGRVSGGKASLKSREKNWWTQAECLSSLAYMSALFPDDERDYFDLFKRQWTYIKEYYADTIHGGWYSNPNKESSNKAHAVMQTYHAPKAMNNAWKIMVWGKEAAINPFQFNESVRVDRSDYAIVKSKGRTMMKTMTNSKRCHFDLQGRRVGRIRASILVLDKAPEVYRKSMYINRNRWN
jgi:mannobiose 2-epimerase